MQIDETSPPPPGYKIGTNQPVGEPYAGEWPGVWLHPLKCDVCGTEVVCGSNVDKKGLQTPCIACFQRIPLAAWGQKLPASVVALIHDRDMALSELKKFKAANPLAERALALFDGAKDYQATITALRRELDGERAAKEEFRQMVNVLQERLELVLTAKVMP